MYDVNCNLVDTDMTLHVYIDLCSKLPVHIHCS